MKSLLVWLELWTRSRLRSRWSARRRAHGGDLGLRDGYGSARAVPLCIVFRRMDRRTVARLRRCGVRHVDRIPIGNLQQQLGVTCGDAWIVSAIYLDISDMRALGCPRTQLDVDELEHLGFRVLKTSSGTFSNGTRGAGFARAHTKRSYRPVSGAQSSSIGAIRPESLRSSVRTLLTARSTG